MLVCQCESINGENARERTQQKMDQEKLIEIVKFHESLYVMNHAKYSDTVYKENVWRRIAKNMNQPDKINNLFYLYLFYIFMVTYNIFIIFNLLCLAIQHDHILS